jgi:hypothetical protein
MSFGLVFYGVMLYGVVFYGLAVSVGVHGSGHDACKIKASYHHPEYHHCLFLLKK